jgi:sulfur relay protein TusB/DsrH
MTKILYLTSKSIYTCAAQGTLLEIILKQINNGHQVAVLLIQDSTLACWKGSNNIISQAAQKGVSIYAIEEDLEARGIIEEKRHKGIQAIDYEQTISLIMDKYEKVITWC